MKWTGLNEIRESYLSFFESKGHLRLPSAPLVPKGDNSVLLINAGMTPLKKYFQGVEEPPCKRVTTCQKCIRTPDIDNVGKTARHGTYFEMLGNFSFGDYFKTEAISWAWEFLTKTLQIPEEKLWVTIYVEDDEAGDIWVKNTSVPRERIVKLGKSENFWEHGSGPCGPCSEIHFDRGDEKGCGKPTCNIECECDRFVEIWNLVFTQFDNDGKGNYTQLANKNIDTGMGLERLACVMQGVDNLFEVDTIQNIMQKICEIANKKYKNDKADDVSIRVITDHIRSTVFMVGDGVRPSNEGRGYVLRRLLRRASRHGRLLGIDRPFLNEVADTVINENTSAYPELNEKRAYIKKVILTEEESFSKTVEKGMSILNDLIDKMDMGDVFKGEDVFKLHDTYGFPLDLTKEILSEKNIKVDEAKFKELMAIQRQTARSNQAFKGGWDEASITILPNVSTTFVGYEELSANTTILALIENGTVVESCSEDEDVSVVIARTPFYAESGGQVGDIGTITAGENVLRVLDTKKATTGQFVCNCRVENGTFFNGDMVLAEVDVENRNAITRNHTSAHLLQAALRKVLGEHVHQAGSSVDATRCRFDFSHFSAVTEEQINEIEHIVNTKILEGIPVITETLPIAEAQKRGAMALFGEKYGDIVRVVSVEGFSTEFCGGTHLDNTAKAGLFKIMSESSVASGVRRIEAVSGFGVLGLLTTTKKMVYDAANILKVANPMFILQRCESLQAELQEKQKQIEKLDSMIANTQIQNVFKNAKEINGIKIISVMLAGMNGNDLKSSGTKIKANHPDTIAVLAGHVDGKGNFLCVCGEEAIKKGADAGKIVKEIANIAGGKGGGKSDIAMAGIADLTKIDEALLSLENIVKNMI